MKSVGVGVGGVGFQTVLSERHSESEIFQD